MKGMIVACLEVRNLVLVDDGQLRKVRTVAVGKLCAPKRGERRL
jgi:hypothetical protein